MARSKKKSHRSPLGAKLNESEQTKIDWKNLSESYENILGTTPLMLAALSEDLDYFKELLKTNSNLDATSLRFGLTLLHFAAMNEVHGKELINFLISEKNLDPKGVDCLGETPIAYAIRARRFENAEELLKHLRGYGCLLEHAIFVLADIEIAKCVLKYDCRHIGSLQNMRAACLAVQHTNVEMFKWLMQNNILRLDDISSDCLYTTALNRNKGNGVNFVRYFAEIWKAGEAKNLSVKDVSTFPEITPIEYALTVQNEAVADELYVHRQEFNMGPDCEIKIFGRFIRSNYLACTRTWFTKHKELLEGFGSSALSAAALFGGLEMNEWLWNELTPADLQDWNPLFVVAINRKYGHTLVPFFVSKGFRVDEKRESNESPLTVALSKGNVLTADAMIKHGAQLEREVALTFMIYSIINDDVPAISFLHEFDRTLAKEAALKAATGKELSWMISLNLFDAREKTDKKQSFLHLIVLNSCRNPEEVFPILVALGLDVNERDICGRTPLHYALLGENPNINFAELLVQWKADIKVKINEESLLHLSASKNELKSAIFLLLSDKGLINQVNMVGETALHIAARRADLEFCKFLVENGIDVSAKNKFGLTALDCVPLKHVEGDLNEEKRNFLQNAMQG